MGHARGFYVVLLVIPYTDIYRSCPMECTMSSEAESWSCSIQIRNEFDSMGRPSPLVETRDFAVINDKSQIELAIRRAQAAVLSPHKEPTYFLGMSATQLKDSVTNDPESLKFSKNVIQINVRDPEATDLSFVDLPGPLLFLLALFNLTLTGMCRPHPQCRNKSNYHSAAISRTLYRRQEEYSGCHCHAYDR